MFIDYIRAGRATRRFIEAHTSQLAQEIGQSDDELSRSAPQPGTERVFATCRNQLDLLQGELRLIPKLIGNDSALTFEHAKIAESRQHLAAVSSSL
jgi:hypothetical protein